MVAPTSPGYGDPADGTTDAGYGDPADGSIGDGYGDPADVDAVTLVPLKGGGGSGGGGLPWDIHNGIPLFSDEGGYEVLLRRAYGTWPAQGPFRVQLISATTGIRYPQGRDGAFGCEAGLGIDCYTDGARKRLRFALPSLPADTYDVRVVYGSLTVVTLGDALRVVERNRAWPEAYSIAKNLGAYAEVAGSLVVTDEPEATAANRPPYPPWEALAKAFGRALRTISGAPTTRIRGDHLAGTPAYDLESILAFPPVGKVWVDGKLVEYDGRDVDAREILLVENAEEGVPGNTPVVLDLRSLAHPGLYREPAPVEHEAP